MSMKRQRGRCCRSCLRTSMTTAVMAVLLLMVCWLPHCQGRKRRRTQAVVEESAAQGFVRKEAFDANGRSLGLSSDENTDWNVSTLELPAIEDGDPAFMYHEGAYEYLVGTNDSFELEIWHPFDEYYGGKDYAAVHLNIMRRLVLDTRSADGDDTMSIRLVNKGWSGVVEEEMCQANTSCPAAVIAGTTQMAARYMKGDIKVLNEYLQDWSEVNGWVLTDDFIKYYFYDFNYLSKWVAVPLVSDTRVLAYNKTTFSSLGIDPPPGPGEVGWEWSDFVDAARRIYEGTGRPGWYFRGSWDEELKIALMIARNWGATFYKEDDEGLKTCALEDTFVAAMNETIDVMLKNNWMSGDFVDLEDETFKLWEASDWPQDGVETPIPNAPDPEFTANSSELWGMSIVSPITIKDILPSDNASDGDIGEAMVPGLFSFLGGSGLFLAEGASEEKQDMAWQLLEYMIDQVSTYALVTRSPPPLERFLEVEELLSTPNWEVRVEQLRSAVPAQYPNSGFPEFPHLESEKPFRLMWLEMKYKNMSVETATQRLNASVNKLLAPVCTEEDHIGCKPCEREDYYYKLGDCMPSTQRRAITFFSEAHGEYCYGGVPPDTSINCSHVEVRSRFGIAIITVSCIGGLLAIVSAFLVYAYQNRPVIKFSQPRFCVLFSLGVAGMCLSNLALVGENTGGSCVARITVWGVAFDLAFGALFSKVYRVRRVLSQVGGRRQRSRRSFLPLVSVVSLAIVVDVLVLTMWSVIDDHGPFLVPHEIEDISVSLEECAPEDGPWAIAFISFKILLIAWGCYLAWVTRRINHALVEGREISWSIYLFAVLAIILIFIGSAGLRVEYWAVAKAFVFCLSSCTALVMVLVPKLWGAHKNVDVNVHQLTAEATAMRGVNSISLGHTHEMTHDSTHPDAPFLVQCTECSATFDVTSHIVKSAHGHPPPPMLAPRAGTGGTRPGIADGWLGGDTAGRGGVGHTAARNWGGTSNVAVASKSSPVSDASRFFPSMGMNKRSAVAAFDGTGSGKVTQQTTSAKLFAPPSNSSSSVLKDTEVGLALKLTKVEGGLRRSPTSSAGGLAPVTSTSVLSSSAGRQGAGSSALGPMPVAGGGPSTSRKKPGWRSMWKRQPKDDVVFSSSPHSELDAASFSRSLQAQAAAMRAALWSSNRDSQTSEAELHAKRMPGMGIGSFGRKAASVTPGRARGRTSASPGSMRTALDAGRLAAKAAPDTSEVPTAAVRVATTALPNGTLAVQANPLHLEVVSERSSASGAAVAGRPGHRVPALQLDCGPDDHNPLVTPPPGRYLLQPWVGGTRPGRGSQIGEGQAAGVFNLRSARIESHATTTALSPGMFSGPSCSPAVTGDTFTSYNASNLDRMTEISDISPASMTSLTDDFSRRMGSSRTGSSRGRNSRRGHWGEESKMPDVLTPIAPRAGHAISDHDQNGSALRRGSSALWGTIDKCDSQLPSPTLTDLSSCSSIGMGAAKTRKLVASPMSMRRAALLARGVAALENNAYSPAGIAARAAHRWKEVVGGPGGAAGPDGEEAPPADTLENDTRAVQGQWERETSGHMF